MFKLSFGGCLVAMFTAAWPLAPADYYAWAAARAPAPFFYCLTSSPFLTWVRSPIAPKSLVIPTRHTKKISQIRKLSHPKKFYYHYSRDDDTYCELVAAGRRRPHCESRSKYCFTDRASCACSLRSQLRSYSPGRDWQRCHAGEQIVGALSQHQIVD